MNAEAPIVGAGIPGEQDPRPIVALPRAGLPGLAVAAICLVAAVLLFLLLDGRRQTAMTDGLRPQRSPDVAFSAPPPLAVPLERQQPALPPLPIGTVPAEPLRLRVSPPVRYVRVPVRAAPPPAADVEAGAAPYVEPPQMFEPAPPPPPPAAFDEPALVIDSGAAVGNAALDGQSGPGAAGAPAPAGSAAAGTGGADANPPRFARIGNPAAVMPVGTLIQAVLETPIDTFKPGLARAIVSRDARGFDGRQVLVPRGSRLTGEYQADARAGQNRVLINWTQLIRPDGSVIRLDSPTADELGGAGVAGRTSGFSLGRFAGGVLRTALAVGTSWAGWSGRGGAVIVGVPAAQLPNVVGQSAGNGRRGRIRVKQGTAFNVFVARNLDFSDVPASR
jgi:type IV secretion system protein VirB10